MGWVDIFAGGHNAPEFKNALLRYTAGFGRRNFRLQVISIHLGEPLLRLRILASG